MTCFWMYVVALLPLTLAQNVPVDGPVINISTGAVQGKLVATHYGVNVHSLMGIPFGAPPLGDLRFEVRTFRPPFGALMFEVRTRTFPATAR